MAQRHQGGRRVRSNSEPAADFIDDAVFTPTAYGGQMIGTAEPSRAAATSSATRARRLAGPSQADRAQYEAHTGPPQQRASERQAVLAQATQQQRPPQVGQNRARALLEQNLAEGARRAARRSQRPRAPLQPLPPQVEREPSPPIPRTLLQVDPRQTRPEHFTYIPGRRNHQQDPG